eukprot:jgi/Ulvmu1/4680/UM002_0411.1
MKLYHHIVYMSLICISIASACASAGDRDGAFRKCVLRCAGPTGCANATSGASATTHGPCPLPLCQSSGTWTLKILGWDCPADCKYHCMHALESLRESQGLHARKYHGKWPFLRIAGMQEIVSVFMSLGNLFAHVTGMRQFLRNSQAEGLRYYGVLWKAYILVSLVAWVASAVFHARDTFLTERLDYIAAFATVMTGFAASVIRCFRIHRRTWQMIAGAGCFAVWLGHMYYMLRIKFDYGWNMQLCVALGLIQAVLWVSWSQISQHPARGLLLTFVLAVNGAMLFELLDFQPVWGIIDAHSVWHALTIAITPLWYRFMITDTASLAESGASKTR